MAIRIDGHPAHKPAAPVPVRVLRIEAGQSHRFRMLSPDIGGLMTHFAQKRSRYCPPDGAGCLFHRQEQIWKGYVAAEQWRSATNDWLPVVLELTEHAELDMRGVYARGQVWDIGRPAERRGKHAPVRCGLVEQLDPRSVPTTFNIHQVLQHLYHVLAIDLTIRNPLPARLVMMPSPADVGVPLSEIRK